VAADVYSLGVMLVVMLLRVMPWQYDMYAARCVTGCVCAEDTEWRGAWRCGACVARLLRPCCVCVCVHVCVCVCVHVCVRVRLMYVRAPAGSPDCVCRARVAPTPHLHTAPCPRPQPHGRATA
jgi:hypothetical protein